MEGEHLQDQGMVGEYSRANPRKINYEDMNCIQLIRI
jgi:hypothetical protein